MVKFDIPILFVIFNRPDTTEKVFQEIRKQQPKYLYVAADGPRLNRPDDVVKCEETRAIIKQVDWDCELKLLFRDNNVGVVLLFMKQSPGSSIKWKWELF